MKRRIRLGVLGVTLILLLALAVPVMAAPPMGLHIEVLATINQQSPDEFTASGPAVEAGTVCGSGESTDVGVAVMPVTPDLSILRVTKQFACDGGGTFNVDMVVRLDLTTHDTTATWRITGGTGDYAGLRGRGSLVGTSIVDGESIFDVYDGWAQ
jgi:hypothetical protein